MILLLGLLIVSEYFAFQIGGKNQFSYVTSLAVILLMTPFFGLPAMSFFKSEVVNKEKFSLGGLLVGIISMGLSVFIYYDTFGLYLIFEEYIYEMSLLKLMMTIGFGLFGLILLLVSIKAIPKDELNHGI